jgi:DNA-directed RNA polymerase specialized sigma24 family protein
MTEVVLRVEEHFESLREPVWSRFKARHGIFSRERFDDAYAEWWVRELERLAAGRPSRAAAPVAFVTEAVHRVLIDEGRARARGLARGNEKAGLELVDIDDQLDMADADGDVPAAAHYEAMVHRILHLVGNRLTTRELRVFVWTFLYLASSAATAEALGLSEPRVKKDRKKIAAKVGEEVWAVLGAELSCSAGYSEKGLLAVCEVLTDHIEDCPRCFARVGAIRRGAVAVVAPVELFALGGDEPVQLIDALLGKLAGAVHRATELGTAVPAGGRAAAATALVAAAAVGGGATAARPDPPARREAALSRPAVETQALRRTPTPVAPAAAPTRRRVATAPATPSPRRRSRTRRETFVAPTPAPTVAADAAGAAAAAARVTPPPAPPVPQATPAAPTGGEFGFERP